MNDPLSTMLADALERDDPEALVIRSDGRTTLDGHFDLSVVARRLIDAARTAGL